MARTTLLTHTLTHTGKGAGGINGHDSAAYHCLMEQIGPEKTKKQTMNGSQSVGKDEVGSSNLPSSSTITALFVEKRAVLLSNENPRLCREFKKALAFHMKKKLLLIQ